MNSKKRQVEYGKYKEKITFVQGERLKRSGSLTSRKGLSVAVLDNAGGLVGDRCFTGMGHLMMPHLELKLWPKEEQALKASAKARQDMLAKVAG